MKTIKNSPILYMGNKSRLIKKGLISLFPENIDLFIDAFGGSASVSMNASAKKYIVNDTDSVLHSYYEIFMNKDAQTIISFIKNRIQEFDLPKKTMIRCYSDYEEVAYYKKNYLTYRDFYNNNKNPLDLYTLMFFAFSQQFRVNKKGDFNMPFGNNHFSQNNEKAILESIDFFKSKDVSFRKVDFVELIQNTNIDTKSFVYLDPPYSITTGSYNENFGWTNADDKRLFDICHIMISKDIKFGMSNVILNKGIKNEPLIEFCKHKNLNIYSPKNFQYHACGLPNKSQQEVFICNYKPSANTGSFVKIDL